MMDVNAAARVVWQAWYDGMQAQGRSVPPERSSWEALPERDKELDARIALALAGALSHPLPGKGAR